jgi:hypothetical protein
MFRPFIFDESTGMKEVGPVSSPMRVYPNPASDRIYFQLPPSSEGKELHIEIIDASGRVIRNTLSSDSSLDVSDLGQGMYYIRAVSGSIIYHSKLVVNR